MEIVKKIIKIVLILAVVVIILKIGNDDMQIQIKDAATTQKIIERRN